MPIFLLSYLILIDTSNTENHNISHLNHFDIVIKNILSRISNIENEIKKTARLDIRCEISLLEYNSDIHIVHDWSPVSYYNGNITISFNKKNLKKPRNTGRSILYAINKIKERKEFVLGKGFLYYPNLVLVTNGYSTDDFNKAKQTLERTFRKLKFITVCIGSNSVCEHDYKNMVKYFYGDNISEYQNFYVAKSHLCIERIYSDISDMVEDLDMYP